MTVVELMDENAQLLKANRRMLAALGNLGRAFKLPPTIPIPEGLSLEEGLAQAIEKRLDEIRELVKFELDPYDPDANYRLAKAIWDILGGK